MWKSVARQDCSCDPKSQRAEPDDFTDEAGTRGSAGIPFLVRSSAEAHRGRPSSAACRSAFRSWQYIDAAPVDSLPCALAVRFMLRCLWQGDGTTKNPDGKITNHVFQPCRPAKREKKREDQHRLLLCENDGTIGLSQSWRRAVDSGLEM